MQYRIQFENPNKNQDWSKIFHTNTEGQTFVENTIRRESIVKLKDNIEGTNKFTTESFPNPNVERTTAEVFVIHPDNVAEIRNLMRDIIDVIKLNRNSETMLHSVGSRLDGIYELIYNK